jgi:hypothetical protein
MFQELIEKGELLASLKQGVITLIPKPNKDSLHIDNWRPLMAFRGGRRIGPKCSVVSVHLSFNETEHFKNKTTK